MKQAKRAPLSLSQLVITAVTNSPANMHEGKRAYFPHILIGRTNERPKFYRSASHEGLQECHGEYITINETGAYESTMEACDALAELFAAAPELLKIAEVVASAEALSGPVQESAARLVAKLGRHRLRWDTHGGPYFHADGSPFDAQAEREDGR